jgi:hypothetical protein
MPDPDDTVYRERLMPTVWMYIFIALVFPATMLVFLPISAPVGVAVAVLLYVGAIGALIYTAPVIEVAGGELRAGRAHIPVSLLGAPAAFTDEEATLERGRRLDARAYLCIRGWVKPVVRVPVTDPADPAPYWLVSTRTPKKLIAAIERSQRLAGGA